jgi:regulator of sirC expression with transglutaminase-like and TPR domain
MDNKELKALISLLDEDDEEIISQIENKILSLGTGIIPYLEEEWESNFSPILQKRIEDIVHNLQFTLLQERLIEWSSNESDDLLKGLWIVATYLYPDTEYEHLKVAIEQIYQQAWVDMRDDLHPHDEIKTLNNLLYQKLKFKGNTRNFHSPANSMLNVVLDTRRGNPITLCIIYLLIAQKLEIPLYGVNLPNMFVLVYKREGINPFYINAFNKGLIFTKEDIDNYIGELKLTPIDTFYEPCSHVDIVKRMFRNLINSFEKQGDHNKADEVKTLLQLISPAGEW